MPRDLPVMMFVYLGMMRLLLIERRDLGHEARSLPRSRRSAPHASLRSAPFVEARRASP
jgi:hypothetical protein